MNQESRLHEGTGVSRGAAPSRRPEALAGGGPGGRRPPRKKIMIFQMKYMMIFFFPESA